MSCTPFFFLFVFVPYLNFPSSKSCWRSPEGPWWDPTVDGCSEGKEQGSPFLPSCPAGLQWPEQQAVLWAWQKKKNLLLFIKGMKQRK